jgi:phosphodiesterase/alkaline phosphatase D-like protein
MQKLIIITADNHQAAINWYHLNLSQFKEYQSENMSSFGLTPILTHQGFIDEAQKIASTYKDDGLVYFVYQDDLLDQINILTYLHELAQEDRDIYGVQHTIDIADITLVDIKDNVATIGKMREDNQLDRMIIESRDWYYKGNLLKGANIVQEKLKAQ